MKDENQKNPLGWTKDSVLTDEIVKCLDSTEGPDYVYTISVQGHGAYPDEQILEVLRSQFPVHRLRKRTINGNIT